MDQLRVLVSLITRDNDYQLEQATAAEQAGARLGMKISIRFADADAVNQTNQVLDGIHSKEQERPNAILVEPVGTGMEQPAAAAVRAGIAWGIINRQVTYLTELRKVATAPVFAVTMDNEKIGAIQGRQVGALLGGEVGTVLCIEGPSAGSASKSRTQGFKSTIPAGTEVKTIRADWTERGGFHAVKSWLALRISHSVPVRIVVAQNDTMAMGARRAFEEVELSDEERSKWLALPFVGCDGVSATGQRWVREGFLAATIVTPPLTGMALKVLQEAMRSGSQPPEWTTCPPSSFPPIERLIRKKPIAKAHFG